MRSVAYALGWHVVQRHRLGLSVLVAGMLGLVFVRELPGIADGVLIGCSIWFLFGLLYVAAIFTQPEADITAPGSGYPNHLFVLPVRTRDLVLWPMLFGGATLAIGWLVVAGVVLNRPPMAAPVLWPACMLTAILSSLQALFWSPARFPHARVVTALGLLGGLIYFGAGNPLGLTTGVLASAFLAVVPISYAVAVNGVGRARRADQAVHTPRKALASRTVRLKPPFASESRAQFWYEFRRGGAVLPIVVVVLCLAASMPLYFEHGMAFVIPEGSISLNVYLSVYLAGLIRGVPFIAWILGGAVRISGSRSSALAIPAFIATRPLTSFELALSRLRARIAGAAIACGILLLCTLIWLLLPGQVTNLQTQEVTTKASLFTLLWLALPPRAFAVAGVYLLLIVAITVRNSLVGQFASLSGRPALAYGYMAAVYGGPIMVLSVLAAAQRGAYESDWLVLSGIAVLIKIVAAGFVMRALYRRRLVSMSVLLGAVGVWCLAVGGVYAAFLAIRSGNGGLDRLLGFYVFHNVATPGILFLLAVFWTPFVRLAAAPLMLDNNRRGAV